jgi:hypothetical protein
MAYGKPQFSENIRLVGPNPMNDPHTFNLNQGLFNLAKDVDHKMADLEHKLDRALTLLQQISSQRR